MVLGQRKTAAKSNEITAIPALLEVLALKGCIVTLDAMGCQREMAAQIRAQQADYVLAVKKNQGVLHEEITEFFQVAHQDGGQRLPCAYPEETDAGHGRVEVRRYWQSDDLSVLSRRAEWQDVKSIGMTESERHVGTNVTVERRYSISSLPLNGEVFGQAVRRHWGVENSLHWVLDVTYREDESRVRRGHAAENLRSLRRLTLNLLKPETTCKTSQKQKRQRAGWDDAYRETVLFGRSL